MHMAPPFSACNNDNHQLPTSGNLCTCLQAYTVRHKPCMSVSFSKCLRMMQCFAATDSDRFNTHTLARWEAPLHVAAPPPVHSKVTKNSLASPGLDTAPTVSPMVQTLARALPSASRLVRPTTQGPRPRHVPAQQPRPSRTLPLRAATPPLPLPLRRCR